MFCSVFKLNSKESSVQRVIRAEQHVIHYSLRAEQRVILCYLHAEQRVILCYLHAEQRVIRYSLSAVPAVLLTLLYISSPFPPLTPSPSTHEEFRLHYTNHELLLKFGLWVSQN